MTCLLACWVCLFVGIAACPCGPVHSNDAADAMQALGFEDGLYFSLDRLCRRDFETQLPSCRRRGTPSPLPGYLDTWGVPAGPGGSLDRQAGVITRSRHTWDGETWWLAKTERGPPTQERCLEVLGPARTSWNITNGNSSSQPGQLGIPPSLYSPLACPRLPARRVPATNLNCLTNSCVSRPSFHLMQFNALGPFIHICPSVFAFFTPSIGHASLSPSLDLILNLNLTLGSEPATCNLHPP